MTYNKLKLNEDKRELLVMSSQFRSRSMVTSIRLGTETIQHRPFVRNLGVILDQDIASDKHIRMICKTSQYHLCNMRNIRKFSDQCSANTLVHSFVTSNIDYCNAFLFGLPKYQISRLQLVVNTAVRVVTLTRKRDRITPVMKSLHW